jgi:hypothetical protein
VFNPKYFFYDPIGVLASVPIEFWWSFLIPFIVMIRRNFRYVEIGLVFSLLYFTFFMDRMNQNNPYLTSYTHNKYWVFGTCFYLGNVAYLLRAKYKRARGNLLFMATSLVSAFIIELVKINLVFTILAVSFLYLIVGQSVSNRHLFGRVVNSFLIGLGTICYSVYLWHLPIKTTIGGLGLEPLHANTLALFCIAVLSGISYLYFEVLCIRLGKRITSKLL